jgi:hypothetical protein
MSLQFSNETTIRRTPNALFRVFEREVAVILPSASAVRVLNEVGGRIWELADGRTYGEIIETLLNEYDIERIQLEIDAQAFLAELHGRGLLEGLSEK